MYSSFSWSQVADLVYSTKLRVSRTIGISPNDIEKYLFLWIVVWNWTVETIFSTLEHFEIIGPAVQKTKSSRDDQLTFRGNEWRVITDSFLWLIFSEGVQNFARWHLKKNQRWPPTFLNLQEKLMIKMFSQPISSDTPRYKESENNIGWPAWRACYKPFTRYEGNCKTRSKGMLGSQGSNTIWLKVVSKYLYGKYDSKIE